MPPRPATRLSSRKHPQQARSAELVDAILEAALQVLAQEGAARFTTTRVAERAGTSVGSLYQYFPNKAALLFRLQSDEWRQTTAQMRRVLEDRRRPPLDRLRTLVHTFVRSECAEAAVRGALHDAAPLYRNAPEATEAKAEGERAFRVFMAETLPDATAAQRTLAGDLISTTFSEVGKRFSGQPRSPEEIDAYADAMADMFCAYLRALGGS